MIAYFTIDNRFSTRCSAAINTMSQANPTKTPAITSVIQCTKKDLRLAFTVPFVGFIVNYTMFAPRQHYSTFMLSNTFANFRN